MSPEAQEYERELLKQLRDLHRDYTRMAEPIIQRIARLRATEPAPVFTRRVQSVAAQNELIGSPIGGGSAN